MMPVTSLDHQIQRLALGEAVVLTVAEIDALDRLGLPVGRAAQHEDGHELLAPLELLDAQRILEQLPSAARSGVDLQVHWRIDSTNSHLMARAGDPGFHGACCLAEQQLAGRGRRGRQWQSPFGRNIYLSLGWRFAADVPLGGLSLVIGMQLVDVLRAAGVADVGLKWPNDVLLNGGKAAGILVEVAPARGAGRHVVIGVGINLALDDASAQSIDQAWSVLPGSMELSRNALCASLLSAMVDALDRFTAEGFSSSAVRWPQYNLFAGKPVVVRRGDDQIEGLDRGIDDDGNLVLDTEAGLQAFNAGEVSLRLAPTDNV